jgi:hypothetical protein
MFDFVALGFRWISCFWFDAQFPSGAMEAGCFVEPDIVLLIQLL